MCNMDEATTRHLPLHILLILAICVCSLAVHFVAEGLAPEVTGPRCNQDTQRGHVHLVDEHCEDYFIFPFLNHLPVERVRGIPAICAGDRRTLFPDLSPASTAEFINP